MKRFVLDCSVTMSWCFEDEVTLDTEKILEALSRSEAIVPSLWPLEVSNVLLVAERRRRLKEADSARFLSLLNSLPIVVDQDTTYKAFSTTLLLAREHHLSAYDATYIELAMREGIPFATLDLTLRKAAKKVGVKLWE